MVNRTEERVTFLGDILDEGMAAARYWAHEQSWHVRDDGTNVVEFLPEGESPAATVDIDVVARGLRLICDGKVEYFNAGYDGATRSRIAAYNRTNGDEADADAIDYDCIIQAGLFGEIVYS
ncbi:Uncharacterised protein [Mycobacteroides abscessus subsp. massiliense]|uniref:hypothetical protein n=1 Tax=Mycobacteroides abscessus TaxID=36809 RepID=UPI0005E90614|nr:hypothetical protein [Mycobacteroides abscessus]CPS25003.1 Uncharacterised protein [Mycobacteroides abscessus]CPV10346.1 Uncharacterised protein [Mycobacteroides abscessus]SKU89179.1 Uncharacterised protein [Mycobacteroides abscessus subsp. massiliense]SKU97350.1 Uncharacterised protein [Mycobacteroides abscessus subsp. massiliense]SKY02476.1 Uncharacterised protein [Mycobacteroides abscessus subsp. massiliense]